MQAQASPEPAENDSASLSSAAILEHLKALPPEEREQYWLTKVYRGNVKQLTVRAVVMGMLIGAVMSVSNLYVGLKIGWGMGVTITAAILAYAIFRVLERILPGGEFTDLENNAMQSVASAAGFMSSAGLVSAIPALMLLQPQMVPTPLMLSLWLGAISILGVAIAVPLKRQMINEDQLPFPSGIAAAETVKSLHGHGHEAMEKARILGLTALVSAVMEYFRHFNELFFTKVLHVKALAFSLPENFAVFPGVRGIEPERLTLGMESSLLLVAAGAIVGLRTGISVGLGAVINWLIVAPWLIQNHIEVNGKAIAGGYRAVVSWATWPGAGMMVVATLVAMAFQWRSILRGFLGIADVAKGAANGDASDVEVPTSWFGGGLAIATVLTVILQYALFGIAPWLGFISVMFAIVLAMVATRVAGETDIAPLGAMGKVTQFAYAALSPHQVTANLMSANVTAGAAAHTSDLLGDLKSGYILGARPRQQFLAQLFGVFAGTLAAVPAYALLVPTSDVLGAKFPAPAAQVWRATAEVLSRGIDAIPTTALHAAAAWILFAIVVTVLEQLLPSVKRFLPSPTGIGLAFIIPFYQSFSIFLGAIAAWLLYKASPRFAEKVVVTGASGLIAGESIMAVVILAVQRLMGEV